MPGMFGCLAGKAYFWDVNVEEFAAGVLSAMGVPPTDEQRAAAGVVSRFVWEGGGRSVMMLCGSAGTGKTTLAGAVVRVLRGCGCRVSLLAPTGRAAKVLSSYAGAPAYTIHRRIYRQKTLDGGMPSFSIAPNMQADTLFIVDEASLISNGGGEYGSGRLLDDLMAYVYGGARCRLMLVGDRAQLPPVGYSASPALSAGVLESYGTTVYTASLDSVVRQGRASGILYNATAVRRTIAGGTVTALPQVLFRGYADVTRVSGEDLVEALSSSYASVGKDETIVVTRSNRQARAYNDGIRRAVLGCEDEINGGDMVMVVKNKYMATEEDSAAPPFIANGDRARVTRVRGMHEQHGFHFADITLSFPDYDGYELTAPAILDTLHTAAPALTTEQSAALYRSVAADYADIPRKAERMQAVRSDRYYGALQIKFAYAVTCHKAQGGQWAHVYVDQGYITEEMVTADYARWLYTAFTRATERLFLINWPDRQTKKE